MADVEIHTATFEPSFIKPLDTASRRRSRASHESAAASTRSWVLMNQNSPPPPEEAMPIPAPEPIPVPDPIPALSPPPAREPRPLPEPPRRTSVIVIDESGAEHMAVELPPGADGGIGYQWTTGRGAKMREAHAHKGFVGGFVSGLRRLPRALVRTRRPRRGTLHTEEGTDPEGTEGTGMTGNTLPRYVSNPTSPVAPDASFSLLRGGLRGQLPENADEGRGPRHPSFRIVPPAEEMQQDIVCDPQQERGDGEARGPSVLEFPQTSLENPYDREAASVSHGPSAVASPRQSRADDHLAAPVDLEAETDEPLSVQAHPLPTEDYRRMSATDAAQPQSRTTITSQSFGDSPSFSSELNGWHRFFNALHVLPWVATDRVTADYRPKAKSKTLVSWYHPEGESVATADTAHSLNGAPIASSASHAASPAPTPRPRSSPRHRTHRRSATLPDSPTPAPPTTYGFPVAYYPAFSPSPPPTQQGGRRAASPRRPHTPRHRHRRRSATYHSHTHTQPVSMPMPAPWVPSPVLPAAPAPVYIIQASPASTPSPPPLAPPPLAPSSSVEATPGSGHATVSPPQGMPGSLHTSPRPGSPPVHVHASPGSPRGDGIGMGGGKPMFVAPVYMQMQMVPSPSPEGSSAQHHRIAFVPGTAGDAQYGYAPYGYTYPGSPIAMPPPAQTAGG